MSGKRVVITGVGMVTSLAMSTPESWSSILAGKSGVKKIMSFDTEKLPCKIASEISNFKAEDYITPGDVRKMDRFIHLGIAAAIEAVEDSNIEIQKKSLLLKKIYNILKFISGISNLDIFNNKLDISEYS